MYKNSTVKMCFSSLSFSSLCFVDGRPIVCGRRPGGRRPGDSPHVRVGGI